MPSRALTDIIIALLHEVVGPRHRHRDHRGGQCHRRTVATLASPPPSLPLAALHCRVLERPWSPTADWSVNWPLVLSDPDAHPRGHQGRTCVIHGWDCPNRIALVHDPSSSSCQGEEEGREEEEDDKCQISVVTSPVGAPTIRRTTQMSIGPWG
jgi:hypothetical protein